MTEIALSVQAQPALFTTNFESVRKALAEALDKYNTVVTIDTIADAKKQAAEINKTKAEINKRKKVAIDEASVHINEFKQSCSELVAMCDDARSLITDQVEKFESERRALALDLLSMYRDAQVDAAELREEFGTVEIDDLAMISSLTKSDNLTAKAKSDVDARIGEKLNLQRTVDDRLTQLKIKSYEAGLPVTLDRQHVEAFLMLDDEQYQSRLDALIEVELKRAAEIERRAAEKAAAEERKRQEELRKQELDKVRAEMDEVNETQNESKKEPQQASDQEEPAAAVQDSAQSTSAEQHDEIVLVATFKLSRAAFKGADDAAILAAFERKVAKEFAKSFAGVSIGN